MFDSLKQAASDVQEKAQEAADKAKQVSRHILDYTRRSMSLSLFIYIFKRGHDTSFIFMVQFLLLNSSVDSHWVSLGVLCLYLLSFAFRRQA